MAAKGAHRRFRRSSAHDAGTPQHKVDTQSERKQASYGWRRRAGWSLVCRCWTARRREERRTKEKRPSGRLGIRDASCRWRGIHKDTHTHTEAHTAGEFLMSEDLTGDTEAETGGEKGGVTGQRGGGEAGGKGIVAV